MLDLQELLRRFRPLVVPPGLAGPATVPVDRTADVMAELAGVLAAIDEIDDEADGIERAARERARQSLAAADLEAAQSVAGARARAPEERALAYARQRRLHQDAIDTRLAAAAGEANRIERIAGERTPGKIAEVLRCTLQGPSD